MPSPLLTWTQRECLLLGVQLLVEPVTGCTGAPCGRPAIEVHLCISQFVSLVPCFKHLCMHMFMYTDMPYCQVVNFLVSTMYMCRDRKKLPFFLYSYIDNDIVVGRGRGGGLAIWTRADKVQPCAVHPIS